MVFCSKTVEKCDVILPKQRACPPPILGPVSPTAKEVCSIVLILGSSSWQEPGFDQESWLITLALTIQCFWLHLNAHILVGFLLLCSKMVDFRTI